MKPGASFKIHLARVSLSDLEGMEEWLGDEHIDHKKLHNIVHTYQKEHGGHNIPDRLWKVVIDYHPSLLLQTI